MAQRDPGTTGNECTKSSSDRPSIAAVTKAREIQVTREKTFQYRDAVERALEDENLKIRRKYRNRLSKERAQHQRDLDARQEQIMVLTARLLNNEPQLDQRQPETIKHTHTHQHTHNGASIPAHHTPHTNEPQMKRPTKAYSFVRVENGQVWEQNGIQERGGNAEGHAERLMRVERPSREEERKERQTSRSRSSGPGDHTLRQNGNEHQMPVHDARQSKIENSQNDDINNHSGQHIISHHDAHYDVSHQKPRNNGSLSHGPRLQRPGHYVSDGEDSEREERRERTPKQRRGYQQQKPITQTYQDDHREGNEVRSKHVQSTQLVGRHHPSSSSGVRDVVGPSANERRLRRQIEEYQHQIEDAHRNQKRLLALLLQTREYKGKMEWAKRMQDNGVPAYYVDKQNENPKVFLASVMRCVKGCGCPGCTAGGEVHPTEADWWMPRKVFTEANEFLRSHGNQGMLPHFKTFLASINHMWKDKYERAVRASEDEYRKAANVYRKCLGRSGGPVDMGSVQMLLERWRALLAKNFHNNNESLRDNLAVAVEQVERLLSRCAQLERDAEMSQHESRRRIFVSEEEDSIESTDEEVSDRVRGGSGPHVASPQRTGESARAVDPQLYFRRGLEWMRRYAIERFEEYHTRSDQMRDEYKQLMDDHACVKESHVEQVAKAHNGFWGMMDRILEAERSLLERAAPLSMPASPLSEG